MNKKITPLGTLIFFIIILELKGTNFDRINKYFKKQFGITNMNQGNIERSLKSLIDNDLITIQKRKEDIFYLVNYRGLNKFFINQIKKNESKVKKFQGGLLLNKYNEYFSQVMSDLENDKLNIISVLFGDYVEKNITNIITTKPEEYHKDFTLNKIIQSFMVDLGLLYDFDVGYYFLKNIRPNIVRDRLLEFPEINFKKNFNHTDLNYLRLFFIISKVNSLFSPSNKTNEVRLYFEVLDAKNPNNKKHIRYFKGKFFDYEPMFLTKTDKQRVELYSVITHPKKIIKNKPKK